MLPPFDLQGGASLCVARGVAVGALLSVFGTLIFRSVVAPKAFSCMPPEIVAAIERRLSIVTQGSAVLGLVADVVWLLLQAGSMADAGRVTDAMAAIPTVLARTAFGHVIMAQFVALIGLSALAGLHERGWRQRAALAVAAVAVTLQAGHSHAYAMYGGPSVLLGCDVLHLLGAGGWLGGLVPLMLLVWRAPPKAGALAARWFSPLGKWCIAVLVVSAAVQGWSLVGSVPGLVGTAYGLMIVAKLALSAVLLGFAAANRYRFAPALLHGDPGMARRVLVRSILMQTGFAVAIVAAAVVLSELPPAMHEQPTWIFAERFSLAAVDEDPDFRREVIRAAFFLIGAGLLVAVSFILRRLRIAAGVLAAVVAWFAIPHLDLLLVTAYPTSFYRSPTKFASASIVAGQAIYMRHCVACHGADGRGDGPAARQLPVPAADLTAAHLWMHSDGELFWWLSHGMATPEGVQAMPGFAGVLDEDERWAAIDFIRARNAGTGMHETGVWTRPVQAPGFDAACGGGTLTSSDLRGRFVLLRFDASPNLLTTPDVVTVVAGSGKLSPMPGGCVSLDETVTSAYAIVAGLDVASLPGTAFLIDEQGWLRVMQREGAPSSWRTPAMLEAEIRYLRAHPAAEPEAAPMNMPM